LKSLLAQETLPDEIVVLDDGSDDKTVEYLETVKHILPQLKWKSQNNLGVGLARKEATKMATSEIIAVLDSDDILYPKAITEYLRMFAEYPDLDMIYGNIGVIDKNGKELKTLKYKSYKTVGDYKRAIFVNPRVPFKHSGMAFKRKSYIDVDGYDVNCRIKIDVDLVLKFILKRKKIRHTEEVVAGFRVHGGNISKKRLQGLKQWYFFIKKYEKNWIKKMTFIITKSIWELLKLAIETTRVILSKRGWQGKIWY
jgi:glycosyltransferase involved in cell wall biosynthesis